MAQCDQEIFQVSRKEIFLNAYGALIFQECARTRALWLILITADLLDLSNAYNMR